MPNGASRLRREGGAVGAAPSQPRDVGRNPHARRHASSDSAVSLVNLVEARNRPSASIPTLSATSHATGRIARSSVASSAHAKPRDRASRTSRSTRSTGCTTPVAGATPSSPTGLGSMVDAISGSQPASVSLMARIVRTMARPSGSAIEASIPCSVSSRASHDRATASASR